MTLRVLVGVSTLLLPLPWAAAAVQNGSFEAPAVPADSYQPVTPTGWAWLGPAGFVFNGVVVDPPSGVPWPTAHAGSQFVDIGNTAVRSLTQTFEVAGTGTYRLSWHENAHPQANVSPYRVELRDAALGLMLAVDADAAHAGTWERQQRDLGLLAGPYTLTFTATGVAGGYDTLLDAVELSAVIPEPRALALVLLGLPLVVVRSRRRRAPPA